MQNRARSSWLPLAVAFLLLAPAASAVTIDSVTAGDPGNTCDTQSQGCFGAVVNGVCNGTVIDTEPARPRCHGTLLPDGTCTGPVF